MVRVVRSKRHITCWALSAHAFATGGERWLPRAQLYPWACDVGQSPGSGHAGGTPDGRRGGHLALRAHRFLREPGGSTREHQWHGPGRHEPSRQVHHRLQRRVRFLERQTHWLPHSDRRRRGPHAGRTKPPCDASCSHPCLVCEAGVQGADLAGLCPRRSQSDHRRAVWCDGGRHRALPRPAPAAAARGRLRSRCGGGQVSGGQASTKSAASVDKPAVGDDICARASVARLGGCGAIAR